MDLLDSVFGTTMPLAAKMLIAFAVIFALLGIFWVVMRFLLRIYDPALNWALSHRKTVLAAAAGILGVSLLIAFGLPREWVRQIRDAGFPRAVVDTAALRVILPCRVRRAGHTQHEQLR